MSIAAIHPKKPASRRKVSSSSYQAAVLLGDQHPRPIQTSSRRPPVHFDNGFRRDSAYTQALLEAARAEQDELASSVKLTAMLLEEQRIESQRLQEEYMALRRHRQEEDYLRAVEEREELQRRLKLESEERRRLEMKRIEAERRQFLEEQAQRRAEAVEWRRESERRRQEEMEALAEARRLAAEMQRRQAEEAERIRRARLKECAVCLEAEDVDKMIQVPCTHWYCLEDLRSR
jgi:hypothetical protein